MGWFSSSINEVKSSSPSHKTQNYVIHIYKRAIRPRCLFYVVAGLLVNWKDEKTESLTRKMLLGFFCPMGVVLSAVAIAGARQFMEASPQILPSLAILLGLYLTFYAYVAITKKCPSTLYHLWVVGCCALTLVASTHGLLPAAGVLNMAMLLLLTLSSEFSSWLYRVIYFVFLAAVFLAGIVGMQQDVLGSLGSEPVVESVYVIRANFFILVSYIIFIVVYIVDRIISRSASGVHEAATFADECCKLLSTYDTKEAASLLQIVGAGPTRLPDKLWESFRTLVEDLHLYRAYLPQHVLGSRRTALDNSTFVVPSSNCSARKMTTVECNTVLLTLQAPDFMSFEEATIFMEAAAGMVSAFKGTVELTSSTVIAASFSTPPPKGRKDKKGGRTTTLALRHEFTPTSAEEAAPEPVWEMVAAEAGKSALDYLRDIGILNVTAVVTSGQLCRTVVEDGDSSSHIVVHGATVLEGVQLSQIRNKRTYMRVIMSEAAALAVCEMVLPTMQIHQQGSKSLLFEYFSMPAVDVDAHRLAIREVFVLIVNGRLESALAGIPDAYAAESLSCARWKAMLKKIIQAPQPGNPQTLGLPILYTGGWVPSGVPNEQAIAGFRSGAWAQTHPSENNTEHVSHQPTVALPPVYTVSTAANLEKTIAQRMRAIVVADDDALFPVFVHEDDSDMEVDEAVRQASHHFSGSGVDTTQSATYEQNQHPHKQVTDTSGSTWSITNRVLGGGAFATVWLATNEMGRPVAAKIINTSHRNISSSAHEIISEVETLSSMRHPHIVSYLSWAMVGKDMYVFMEWVGYGSLRMMMDQCKVIPIDMVQKYVLHALSGLIFLHNKGIVHCDVKPHNLLVEANGCVKIADFGSVVSCMNRDDRPVIRRYVDPTQPEMSMTEPQEMVEMGHEDLDVKGTAWYMAPEACRGDVEAVSDVWSLGITVAEVLSGQLPFTPQDLSTSQSRFIQRVGSGMIKPTITHSPLLLSLVETYPQLGSFLRECWEFNPRNRLTANKIQDQHTSWI